MLTALQQRVLKRIHEYSLNGEYWCIGDETGILVHDLILKHGLSYAVECGSGIGCSTLWIASAIHKQHGKMFGFEFFEPKCLQANAFMREARLGSTVEIIRASAAIGIPHLERGVDFVFLDARKCDYLRHLQLLLPKLKKGAILVADNISSHKEELSLYTDFVRSRFRSEFHDIGTGVEVSYL